MGLGKTIEAGLVIAQLLAEGWQRVIVIVPKTVLGQWQNELYTLFGIETQEGSLSPDAFIGAGVFLASRDFAGSEKGSSLLRSVAPFNLRAPLLGSPIVGTDYESWVWRLAVC